jgi:predicted nucleic-acid-binding Zn-ribbon protein
MSRNAFPKIEREQAQSAALREHNAMERAMGNCPHETGTRRKEFDMDGCGYYVWTCNECGYSEIDDMP